jgi:predicted RNA-binding Zn-ribbon protein involved in translation (DUF1610 family)
MPRHSKPTYVEPYLDQSVTNQIPIIDTSIRDNVNAPCWACGEAGGFKAQASRNGETRYFCHNERKSCYNEYRGRYFDVEPTDTSVLRIPRDQCLHAAGFKCDNCSRHGRTA